VTCASLNSWLRGLGRSGLLGSPRRSVTRAFTVSALALSVALLTLTAQSWAKNAPASTADACVVRGASAAGPTATVAADAPAPTAAPSAAPGAAPVALPASPASTAAPVAPPAGGTGLQLRPSTSIELAPQSSTVSLTWKLVLSLGVILGGVGLVWMKRRRPTAAQDATDLRIISRTSLGPRSEILVVEGTEQQLVLGLTAGTIQLLTTLPLDRGARESAPEDPALSPELAPPAPVDGSLEAALAETRRALDRFVHEGSDALGAPPLEATPTQLSSPGSTSFRADNRERRRDPSLGGSLLEEQAGSLTRARVDAGNGSNGRMGRASPARARATVSARA